MSAYLIAQINIINTEPYKEYLKQTTLLVKKYDGEFIVRAGKFENVFGNNNNHICNMVLLSVNYCLDCKTLPKRLHFL